MKNALIIFTVALAVFVVSCSKDNTSTPKPSPLGFWKGQWSNTSPSTPPDNNFLFLLFRSDGTLRQFYDATDTTGLNKASGSWAVTNDSIINWTNAFGESYAGKIRSSSTQIVGTWGSTPSSTNAGQFTITKQ